MLRLHHHHDDSCALEFGDSRFIYTNKSFRSRTVVAMDRCSFFIIVNDTTTLQCTRLLNGNLMIDVKPNGPCFMTNYDPCLKEIVDSQSLKK